MPNAATTQASSACETTGTPIPLAYGYQWVTGKRIAYYTLQETGLSGLDYTRAGIWLLGHGEWDGPMELWINDLLSWRGSAAVGSTWLGWSWLTTLDYPGQDMVFNWHSGCDAVIGSGLTPQSTGPDQGCDKLWSVFPPAIQPLCYSRIAYYSLMRKQPILWQQNNNQEDPSQWTDINPVGLWRALRCRIFDGDGNVLGYAFTRNPVWHWVDVTLRRELFPDYNLIYQSGPDPLPAAVTARFNWGKIYDSAQYCNAVLANGAPRFSADYAFTSQTSLQAIKTKMLRACRGFEQESQGQIAIIVDQARAPVFTFSRDHILPGSWSASDAPLNTAGNRLLSSFRDVLVPACSSILSISNPLQGAPTVTTDSIPPTGTAQPHPFQAGDQISIGGTGTVFDGEWTINTVPAIINPGTPDEVDPTTFTTVPKGNNYPTSLGAVGVCGLLYSRFKERTPEFWHKNNMVARGAYALNLARQRNKVKDALDFDTSTYDQVSRVSRYERDRNLGFDVSPYVAPARVKFKTSMFARDVNGNLACGIEAGDRVVLDATLRWPYAGDYEVVDPLVKTPPQCSAEGTGATLVRTPDSNSGEMSFSLQSYNEEYFYDTSDPEQAGWLSVPGSYPGNDSSFTSVPLANGGDFVFFTGQAYSGNPFQLPSTGYPAGNVMAWASPAGSNPWESLGAEGVRVCSVDLGTLIVTLIYNDGGYGHIWYGDVNYAALTWLGPDVTNTDANGMTWLPLTLLGGEQILFGMGTLADGATIELPPGWSTAQAFAKAYIHDTTTIGSAFYLAGAWVDSSFVVHCKCQNHSGTTWPGNASVLVFAWKNNMGTVTTQTLGPGTWIEFPLTDGSKFGVGSVSEIADGATLELPSDAGSGSTLQAQVGPSDSFYTTGDPTGAQGIGTCYLDSDNVVHCTFNNTPGTVWSSTADIFAIYTVAASAPSIVVTVSPASATIPQASAMSFSALVSGSSNQAVTWSVDGVAGGNATVGTIDASGNYTAPTLAGTHTITATSAADSAVAGSALINVTGASSLQLALSGSSLVATAGGSSLTLSRLFTSGSVALAAPNGGTSYTVGDGTPVTLANPADSFYFVNGRKMKYGVYYTISGTTLTLLIPAQAPQSGDTHELYGS